ncbi:MULTISPECIES: recombinase family protein [Bacillus cereus group]|uniref:Resolvase/invertase-type recombinase catalytic domain-containing protein n=1 Tax=Bacillus thuringiensis Bt18247 TaxID=1423143 RepID=A0A9W3SR37_BACTU|nr:hypothetical protein BTI247_15560 [Bacillus thuringiensis Bt18247]
MYNLKALQNKNCGKIYSKNFTGTTSDRSQFNIVLSHLSNGDTLVITKLDRFIRDMRKEIEVIEHLFKKDGRVLNAVILENTI